MFYNFCKSFLRGVCLAEQLDNKQLEHKELENNGSKFFMLFGVLSFLTLLIFGYSFLVQGSVSSSLEKQVALVSLVSGFSAVSTAGGALDMSDWTANEKMNYEMHGTIPARAQTSTQSSSAASTSAGFSDVLPAGTPAIYGSELGIKYDDISASNAQLADATIAKMAKFDNDVLQGEILNRYIAVTTAISCEYCCGAEAITFSNGQAACGCAHSGAMRGLAKYLLEKHAAEFTNDQILEELGKWKALYFPDNAIAKAQALKQNGIEFNYINLMSNKYRDLEKGVASGSGAQVGGC